MVSDEGSEGDIHEMMNNLASKQPGGCNPGTWAELTLSPKLFGAGAL